MTVRHFDLGAEYSSRPLSCTVENILRRFIGSSLAGLAALASLGCSGKSEARFVGNWKVKEVSFGTVDEKNPKVAEAVKKLFANAKLEITKEKSFNLALGFHNEEGEWSLSGDSVALNPKTSGGQPLAKAKGPAKPFIGKLNADGNILTLTKAGVTDTKLVFEKVSGG